MSNLIAAAMPRAPEPELATRDPNFYVLPFAPQMIIWAVRKRLGAICDGRPGRADDEVLQVFHMANWGELYAALLTIVDLMVAGTSRNLTVHAVSCPCLARHEAYLLNALAHLQSRHAQEAALSLCELMPPSAVRLALPHIEAVVAALSEQKLRLVFVDVSALGAPRRPAADKIRNLHVH